MTTKEINGQTYLFVEVPEVAYEFNISGRMLSFLKDAHKWNRFFEKLPPEYNYTIIGKANELNEKQIRLIIPSVSKYHVSQKLNQQSQYDMFWVNVNGKNEYFDKKVHAYDFAFKMELQSLLSSIGMKEETTLILKLNKP